MNLMEGNAFELLDAAYRIADFWVEFHDRNISRLFKQLENAEVQRRPKTVALLREEVVYHKQRFGINHPVRAAILEAMRELNLDVPKLEYDEINGTYTWTYPEVVDAKA